MASKYGGCLKVSYLFSFLGRNLLKKTRIWKKMLLSKSRQPSGDTWPERGEVKKMKSIDLEEEKTEENK